MLRRIAQTSLASRMADQVFVLTGFGQVTLIKQILQRQLPDVTLFYANKTSGPLTSQSLTALVYHELSHTQHYNQVGNNFWTAYITHILDNNTDESPYGPKSASGSGRIAISEGWANYVERLFVINKYQAGVRNDLARTALDELEEQEPGDVGDKWFVYGMYHDMTDNTVEPSFTRVRDNVNAYTPTTVFRGLQPNVTTVREYQTRVNAQNGNVQAAQLNTLVTDYRW